MSTSAQSKDEDCMYLKIKQGDLNNPFIRKFLGYDKVIQMKPDLEPSSMDVKMTMVPPVGSLAVVGSVIKQEELITILMQPVVPRII